MFVIMQCLSNLSDQQKSTLPLPEQIGEAMRHAGVAISITSLTDVCAFGVGAVTVRVLYYIPVVNHTVSLCITSCITMAERAGSELPYCREISDSEQFYAWQSLLLLPIGLLCVNNDNIPTEERITTGISRI